MKNAVLLAGIALTVLCALLYVFEPPLIQTLSHRFYDRQLEAHHSPPQSDKVVVVDLDEKSFEQFGQWPWPRYLVAELTDRLLDAGASVVAFDIVFAEADRTSPARVTRELNQHFDLNTKIGELPPNLSDYDALLAHTLRRGKVVLGCFMHPLRDQATTPEPGPDPTYRGWFYTKGTGDLGDHLFHAKRVTLSIPELRAATGNSAFFNTVPHSDTIVRNTPLVWAHGQHRIYPSLALEAVRLHLGVPQVGIEYNDFGITHLQLGQVAVVTDSVGRFLINHRAMKRSDDGDRFTAFPFLSAGDVLAGAVDPASLRDKIVLVGTSAPGLRDMRATPLAAPVAGVEIHAAIIDNILTGDFLREPTWMWALDLAAVILVCLVLTLATCKGRSWLSFLVALAAIAGALGASQWIFTHMQLVLTPVHMVLAVTLTYPTLTTISFWQHERHERWIRENFGAMVSDKVLTYLESTPRDVVLAGRKTEATILFTDIAGFSGIAEQLEPDALSDLLNRYLSPMTEIIMRHDGYVDKYVGDMIMADWGVPHRVENHAREACLAALEMVTHLKTLRTQLHAEFGHELYARIGINSGTVTAGNMGSDRRFQYSVMGDAVNLAARLEPLNKAYGTQVIVGESTANAVREPFIFRHLDRATVAGKSHAAEVFELVGKRGEVSEKVIEMVATYEIALQARWRGDLEQAQALLNQALTLVPGDPPSIKMLDLIRWEMTSGKGATRPGPLALAS